MRHGHATSSSGHTIVESDGEDYPEEAPTVAVTDLRELGIDPASLGLSEPTAPVRKVTPERPVPAAVVPREAPRMAERKQDASPATVVLLLALPVLAGLGAAAFMLFGR